MKLVKHVLEFSQIEIEFLKDYDELVEFKIQDGHT
jgi:hypothetical protein